MEIIQQIVLNAVEEIFETIKTTGLNDIGKTIKALVPATNKMVLDIVTATVEQMDLSLVEAAKAQRRRDGITVKEREVERTLTTELGDLHYKRTYFALPNDTHSYLLDQIIGVEAYERFSKELIADVLQASTVKSYQAAIDSTKQEMSRQTVHNRLVALDDLAMPVERIEQTPEVLDIFADEDHVHMTPKRNAIVPLVTITEGMDKSNPKRHATIHPFHIAAYGMPMATFQENVLAVLTEKYDLEKVKQINIHGDGGSWIYGLQQLIPNSRLVLDEYHLEKELRSFLKLDGASCYAKAIREFMHKEDGYEAFEHCCESIYAKQTTEAAQKRVKDFVGYCANHWHAIVVRMSNETCGSCTEPLVSHVLSDRLSRDPISWSKDGLNRMTMLVVYSRNGGKVTSENVRIRRNCGDRSKFIDYGYAIYSDYAMKQADKVLKVKHDWSIFEHDCSAFGKVDGTYLLRKSVGSVQSIANLVS